MIGLDMTTLLEMWAELNFFHPIKSLSPPSDFIFLQLHLVSTSTYDSPSATSLKKQDEGSRKRELSDDLDDIFEDSEHADHEFIERLVVQPLQFDQTRLISFDYIMLSTLLTLKLT